MVVTTDIDLLNAAFKALDCDPVQPNSKTST